MLRHSNNFLENCSLLKDKNILFPIKPGVQLARGFADLGYEEFILVENEKLISVYRGNESEFADSKSHLFRVPTEDELRQKIYELGYDFLDIKFDTKVSFKLTKKNEVIGEYSSLNFSEALLKALVNISESLES